MRAILIQARNWFQEPNWFVLGDFKSMLRYRVSKGVIFGPLSSRLADNLEFGSFYKDMRLADLCLLGRRFTSCH